MLNANKCGSRPRAATVIFLVLCVRFLGAGEIQTPAARIERGERFLTNLFNPSVELLPEYAGAKVFWIYHDNYLATQVLQHNHPQIAGRIRQGMVRSGVEHSGKIEGLFNPSPALLPFRDPILVTVQTNTQGFIRTEKLTERLSLGWTNYADLLFFAAIGQAAEDPGAAREHYDRALRMWDGHGFADVAATHLHMYSTYKLGLALLTAARLQADLPMHEAILQRLGTMQSESGGWITDYNAEGSPRGVENVETTCLVILGLRTVAEDQRTIADVARKPNIVFILADDLGYGDLGCYGQKKIRTPTLDRLAAEGMRFTQHYSGNAVCAPSRCVLMTGKHPGHAWIRDNREVQPEGQPPLPAGTITIAKLLKKEGYATAAMGKWGLGFPGSEGDPLKQGFDRFFGYNCQRHAHNYYPTSLWDNDRRLPLNNARFAAHQKFPSNAEPANASVYDAYTGKDYAPDLIREQALRFIRENRERPFFLYYATTVPHLALQVPEDSLAEYDRKWPEEPYLGERGYLPHRTPRAAYAAMVTRLDRDVGKLWALVKELGLDDQTMIVFTSDNGPLYNRWGGTDTDFFNSAGILRGRKGSLYEGGIRVPLIARWPGRIPAGTISDRVTGFEDWLPTILELTGTTNLESRALDGISFAPTLQGRSQPERPFLYREFPGYGGWQMVRVGDWKAVRLMGTRGNVRKSAVAPLPATELYNLREDPGEEHDRAASQREVLARLEKTMQEQHHPSDLFPLRPLDRANPLK